MHLLFFCVCRYRARVFGATSSYFKHSLHEDHSTKIKWKANVEHKRLYVRIIQVNIKTEYTPSAIAIVITITTTTTDCNYDDSDTNFDSVDGRTPQ